MEENNLVKNNLQKVLHKSGEHISYHQINGDTPNIIFLHGLMSDMNGTKALAIENFAKENHQGFIRFDCRGHGQSSGSFPNYGIDDWAEDAELILTKLTTGPQILIGSSMGGWSMLLTALKQRHRIGGLIGIAAAPDFTHDNAWKKLKQDHNDELNKKGYIELPSAYKDSPYIISKTLIDSGDNHLLLNKTINLDCPIRLLHGLDDKDVSIEKSLKLIKCIKSQDATLTIVKDSDHQFSSDQNIELIIEKIKELTQVIKQKLI